MIEYIKLFWEGAPEGEPAVILYEVDLSLIHISNEAITESRRIMNGNKWRLFCLDFSFLGWELLCSVPLYAEGFLVLKYFTGSEALAISLVLLLTIPLSIGFFFVRPYEEAAWATFYRDITAEMCIRDRRCMTT